MRLPLGWPIVALSMSAAATAWADEPRAPERLRIATWDLTTATAAGVLKLPETSKAVWRTTFGAERRNEVKPSFDPTNIDADVILLQGVTNVREVRRFFPARAWRVVVSRQILTPEAAAEGHSQNPTTGPVTPTTAIAIRLRRGLRVATQEHLLALAEAAPGSGSTPAAGVAVRLINFGRTVWVASAALEAACTSPAARCPANEALANWVKGKSAAADQTVVVGGRLQRSTVARAPEPVAQKAAPASPAPSPPAPPPKTADTKAAASQTTSAIEKPRTSTFEWLTGWFVPADSKMQIPAPRRPEERLSAEAPPAGPAPPPPKPASPAPQVAAPPAPVTAAPIEEAVARKLERDGNKLKLADTDTAAACPKASLAISLSADGHARAGDSGFAQEKAGCLVMVDLTVDPAPPPPPELWPETVEPPGGATDPDVPADDARR